MSGKGRTMNGYEFSVWLKDVVLDVHAREEACFLNIIDHVEMSVLVGSDVSGAPGQPIDTGELINSWSKYVAVQQRYARFQSSAAHAEIIETNARGARLRSKVGGFHSVAITQSAMNRIISYEASRIGAIPFTREAGGRRYRDPKTGRFAKRPA